MNRELLTIQEHSLFGSNVGKDSDSPYIPLAVLKGVLSIEGCNKERLLENKLSSMPAGYFGIKYMICDMTLEPLNLDKSSEYYGQTIRDPMAIGAEIFCEKARDFSERFPYARETKPRVKI